MFCTFAVILIAQKAKDGAFKLVVGHIYLATHRLINQAVEILPLMIRMLGSVARTRASPTPHIY